MPRKKEDKPKEKEKYVEQEELNKTKPIWTRKAMISKMTSTPSFTSRSPTTGKTTWPSSTSPSKVNSSSALSFSSPSALPLIFSRTKNRKTRSNSTFDEFLSWTTVTSSFLSSSTSSRVLSIRKIFL